MTLRSVLLILALGLLLPASSSAAVKVGVGPAVPVNHAEAVRLANAGTDSLRLVASWRQMESTPDVFNFTAFDQQYKTVAETGIDVMPVIVEPPVWAREPGATTYPDGRATAHYPIKAKNQKAFIQFVERFTNRYGRGGSYVTANNLPPITEFQIWSEPNVRAFARFPDFKKGGPLYGKFLIKTSKAIRKIDPDATIVTAGMADRARDSAFDLFIESMLEDKKVLKSFDVLAIQPFQVQGSVTAKATIKKTREYTKIIQKSVSKSIPVWITEVASATDGEPNSIHISSEGEQAKILRKLVEYARDRQQKDNLDRVYWYGFRDISPANLPAATKTWNDYTGLFDFDGEPKPAWFQYANLAGGSPGSGPLP